MTVAASTPDQLNPNFETVITMALSVHNNVDTNFWVKKRDNGPRARPNREALTGRSDRGLIYWREVPRLDLWREMAAGFERELLLPLR
jgi:hypothetical protein